MTLFRRFRVSALGSLGLGSLALGGLMLGSVLIADGARADQRYDNPRHQGGGRLDFCLRTGQDCGRPVAEEFCWRLGHRRGVRDFQIAHNVGPTQMTISTQLCRSPDCDGFRHITCWGAPADTRFVNPLTRGVRLDACVTFGQNCGTPAANMFCATRGYHSAKAWRIEDNVGRSMTITGQECVDPNCDAFDLIECTFSRYGGFRLQ